MTLVKDEINKLAIGVSCTMVPVKKKKKKKKKKKTTTSCVGLLNREQLAIIIKLGYENTYLL